MGAEDAKRTNPFLSYVEPNAIVPPEMYEKCALYGLLYTSIANDLVDQGFKNSMTLNVMVTARVEEYVTIMEKLLNGVALTDKERESEKNVRDYMKLYVPIDDPFNDDGSVNLVTREANLAYLGDFKKQYNRVVGEMGKIIAYAKANGIQLENGMLSRDQVELLLLAKREKCREFYDLVRGNCDGKPGKIDKKEGSSKEGVHLRLYREGKNKILKDKDKIRKEGAKNFGKILGSVALWGVFGLGVVFTGGALSPTLAGLVGSGMSAAGIGQFFTGLVASIISFRGGLRLTKMSIDGVKANYKRRKDLKEFMGPRITADRMDELLANYSKDGKDLTFNERKALLMFDKACKMYFEKGKVEGEFDGEQLSKYLPQELIDKYKYAEDARRFRLVSDKGGLYDRMFLKLPNEPTELIGDGTMGRSDVISLYNQAMSSPNPTLDSLQETIQRVIRGEKKIGDEYDKYMRNLGTRVGDAVGSAFFSEPHTKNHAKDVNVTVTKTPAFTTALALVPNVSENIENAYAYYQTVSANAIDTPLNDDVGVSLTAQLTYNKDSMVSACEGINGVTLTPARKAEVETIAEEIVNLSDGDSDSFGGTGGAYTSVDNVGAIETLIKNLSTGTDPVDPKVASYLTYMLEKKKKGVSRSAVNMLHKLDSSATGSTTGKPKEIADAIAKFVINDKGEIVTLDASTRKPVTGYETISAAKATIMAMSDTELPADKKAIAIRLLEERVQALEAGKRNEVLQGSIATINASKKSPNEMKEFQERLGKINFASVEKFEVDGMSFTAIYDEYILRGTLKDYNKQLFQQAIQKAIKSRLDTINDFTNATNGLDNIIALMKKVNECSSKGYLSEGQALQIMSTIEPLLEEAVSVKFKDLKEQYFLSSSDPKAVYALASNLLKYEYSDNPPGLKNYFDMKTPTTLALESQINYMTKLANAYNLIRFNAGGVPGSTVVKMNDDEARAFATVYFSKDKRDSSDGLMSALEEMKTASTKHNTVSMYNIGLNAKDSTPPHFGDDYLKKMQEILDNIIGTGTSSYSLSDEEKYAALLVAKTRCVAMYKSYLMKAIQQYGSGPNDFMNASDDVALSYLDERVLSRGWRSIFDNIEKAYDDLRLGNTFDKVSSYLPNTATRATAYGYATNDEMQPRM